MICLWRGGEGRKIPIKPWLGSIFLVRLCSGEFGRLGGSWRRFGAGVSAIVIIVFRASDCVWSGVYTVEFVVKVIVP